MLTFSEIMFKNTHLSNENSFFWQKRATRGKRQNGILLHSWGEGGVNKWKWVCKISDKWSLPPSPPPYNKQLESKRIFTHRDCSKWPFKELD